MSSYHTEGSSDSSSTRSRDPVGEVKSERFERPDSAPKKLPNVKKEEPSEAQTEWKDPEEDHLGDIDYWGNQIAKVLEIRDKVESPVMSNRFMHGYFMPYLGEADPTYTMIFKKEDSSRYTKFQNSLPFKTVCKPNENFICFSLEVASYIYEFQDSGGISRTQYASLLSPHFSNAAWSLMMNREPNEMFMAFATTSYG